MASIYHKVVSIAGGATTTLTEDDLFRLKKCDRHEVDVTGTVNVSTRKEGKSGLTDHGSVADTAKAIELSQIDQIVLTATGAATVAITGKELI